MSSNNPTIRHFLCLSAIALALPAAALAQSQSAPAASASAATAPAPAQGRHHHAGLHAHMGSETGFMHGLHGVDLSSEQRDKLRTLMQAQRETMRGKHEAARDARQALHQLVLDGKYTPEAAQKLADEIGKQDAALALAMAEAGSKAREILTPEQRTKLAERMKARGPGR